MVLILRNRYDLTIGSIPIFTVSAIVDLAHCIEKIALVQLIAFVNEPWVVLLS